MASDRPWFRLFVNRWLASTDISLLSPLEELALFRIFLHLWKSPDCMLPDDDRILSQLSRLRDHYSNKEGALSDGDISNSLANVKQVLSKSFHNGKHMVFSESLLEEKHRAEDVRDKRSSSGKLGGRPKSSGTSEPEKPKSKSLANVKQTPVSISLDLPKGVSTQERRSEEFTLPSHLETPEVRTALADWFAYKRERKESYKPIGLKAFITKLGNDAWTADRLIAAITNSMSKGWKGIYEDQSKGGYSNGTHKSQRGESRQERLEREEREEEERLKQKGSAHEKV